MTSSDIYTTIAESIRQHSRGGSLLSQIETYNQQPSESMKRGSLNNDGRHIDPTHLYSSSIALESRSDHPTSSHLESPVQRYGASYEVISELSDTSSRSGQMSFLMNEMGLDKATAGLLYRAERLQEKGHLKQASKYYEKVLIMEPNCRLAIDSMNIIRELQAEEEFTRQIRTPRPIAEEEAIDERLHNMPRRLPLGQRVNAESNSIPHSTYPIVTEMDVNWSEMCHIERDHYPDPEKAAFRAARHQLKETGYGKSLLKLLKNETLQAICNAQTDYDTYLVGRARFQVTLIPDNNNLTPRRANDKGETTHGTSMKAETHTQQQRRSFTHPDHRSGRKSKRQGKRNHRSEAELRDAIIQAFSNLQTAHRNSCSNTLSSPMSKGKTRRRSTHTGSYNPSNSFPSDSQFASWHAPE